MSTAIDSGKLQCRLRARLAGLHGRFEEVEGLISDPAVIADVPRYKELVKEHGRLSRFARLYDDLVALDRRIEEAEVLLAGPDMDEDLSELAREELEEARRSREEHFSKLLDLWVGEGGADSSVALMEIRAGTGGEEAALFAADLMRMYQRFAERRDWKTEVIDASPTDLGGFREVVLRISGPGCYRALMYESGGHRVQRVPETEAQGRIHTSLATVAVLPEVDDVEVEINKEDLEIQRIRSQGPGGQKVNKTSSCIRLIHKPSGIQVRCQDEKSQFRNLDRAMKILASKLHALKEAEAHESRDALRRTKVGSGDRNERIRTYNFPQDRVTDHRIGLDLFGIEKILMGEIDDLAAALAEYDKQARLQAFIREQEAQPEHSQAPRQE